MEEAIEDGDVGSVVAALVDKLESSPEVLVLLTQVIGEAYDSDGVAAGAAFRAADGVRRLIALLQWWNMLAPSETHLADVADLRRMALEL